MFLSGLMPSSYGKQQLAGVLELPRTKELLIRITLVNEWIMELPWVIRYATKAMESFQRISDEVDESSLSSSNDGGLIGWFG
ncbi:predicted protein [Botrytis cinerea T4]|uniref:Uncharacterized protein n=1 Tax=Botryotinia fuckeliana (strain T4) TaxID=999810 RepID=G2Y6N1_BOTF4|nr:predicted protein [Botrytis cinerea T4]